eukprot:scaffold304971_cov37-Tisochrysis_lutea.AAC.2
MPPAALLMAAAASTISEALHTVETGGRGVLRVREVVGQGAPPLLTLVTVHPWTSLGGGEHNTLHLGRHLAAAGLRALTFELNASSALWGIATSHAAEVQQVVYVARWAERTFGVPVVLLGSSAGAPIAGSALARLPGAFAYVAVGYTWGGVAMLAFGRHYRPLYACAHPKLFIMGERDEFTAPETLRRYVGRLAGDENEVVVVPGVGHFELEHPAYDGEVVDRVVAWLERRLRERAGAGAATGLPAAADSRQPECDQ